MLNGREGKYPTYLRAPYTACTTESGCRADVKAFGYHLVHYDLTTEDYLHPGPGQIQTSKDIVKETLDKALVNGNLLVVQHDIISQSAGNLTEMTLQLVRRKGWKGMSDLLPYAVARLFRSLLMLYPRRMYLSASLHVFDFALNDTQFCILLMIHHSCHCRHMHE
jgi:hypothetical protein